MANKELTVYIDSREQNRIDQAKKYYESQGLTVEVKELPIGDYLFTDGENEVVFEFKTIADFIGSIIDNRVFNEAINQAENYDYHFVVVHGDEHTRSKCLAMTKNYQRVTIFQYIGAMSSLNRYTTVLEVYSPFIDEAFYRMLSQTRKCLSSKPVVKKFNKKVKNPAFNWLCYCNYGLNAKKSQLIVDELGLETLSDLQAIELEDLTSIKGIGESTANRIIKGLR